MHYHDTAERVKLDDQILRCWPKEYKGFLFPLVLARLSLSDYGCTISVSLAQAQKQEGSRSVALFASPNM